MGSLTICEYDAKEAYDCAGSGCGHNVLVATQDRYCPGNGSSCNGLWGPWSDWSVADSCSSTETCTKDDSTCNYTASCAAECDSGDSECTGGPYLDWCSGGQWQSYTCSTASCQDSLGDDYYFSKCGQNSDGDDGCLCGKVDPEVWVSPSSANKGAIYQQDGSGFWPGGTARLYFQKPDGTVYEDYITEPVDSSGEFEHAYNSSTASIFGTYKFWAEDLTTGKTSSKFSYTINP